MNHSGPVEARAVLITSPVDDELHGLLSRLKEANSVREKGDGLGFRVNAHDFLCEKLGQLFQQCKEAGVGRHHCICETLAHAGVS